MVRSIFVRYSGVRSVTNLKQYSMPLRSFLSSAATEGHLDNHPAAFSCAIARCCELLPGESNTLRLRAAPVDGKESGASDKSGGAGGAGMSRYIIYVMSRMDSLSVWMISVAMESETQLVS